MVEVAKALGRPPTCRLTGLVCGSAVGRDHLSMCCLLADPCKFFGCELGAQTQMDVKVGRYIVNGSHEGSKLQDLLDGFILTFVLCPECDNPETDLVSLVCYHGDVGLSGSRNSGWPPLFLCVFVSADSSAGPGPHWADVQGLRLPRPC